MTLPADKCPFGGDRAVCWWSRCLSNAWPPFGRPLPQKKLRPPATRQPVGNALRRWSKAYRVVLRSKGRPPAVRVLFPSTVPRTFGYAPDDLRINRLGNLSGRGAARMSIQKVSGHHEHPCSLVRRSGAMKPTIEYRLRTNARLGVAGPYTRGRVVGRTLGRPGGLLPEKSSDARRQVQQAAVGNSSEALCGLGEHSP